MEPIRTVTTTLPTLTRTGLTNGSTYEAQVRATNGVGQQSSYSPSGTATPAAEVPDQVQFVGLTNTPSAIEADWGEPENNGASVTGYRIQWDDNATFSSPQSANPTNSARTITGLADGTMYYVRVRAVNSAGNGTYSPTSSLTRDDLTNVPSSPPNAPIGEHVIPSSIFWEWEVPRDNGAQITSFDLQWRISGNNWSGNNITGIDASCYTHTGRTLGTTYQIRVRARNSAGVGGWSGTGTFALPSTEGGLVPEPPSAPSAAQNDNQVRWTWTPPTGFTILDHEFQTRLDGEAWPPTAFVGLSGALYDFFPVPGSSYDARARVRLSGGASGWSETGSVSGVFQNSRIYLSNTATPDHVEVYNLSGTRQTSEEFNLISGDVYGGISVSGSRIYVPNDRFPAHVEVYNLSGTRQTSEEFNLISGGSYAGISVSGSRIYLSNSTTPDHVEVYNLSGTRQTSEEFNLISGDVYGGISVSGSRIYVLNDSVPDHVEVYNLSGTRQTSEEFNLISGGSYTGISVSGSRIYVLNDSFPTHVEVYNLSGTRQTGEEFDLPSGGSYRGISSVFII